MELQKYKVEIELLSDALVGSAEGYGAVIDKDSVFDEVGLPLIPGKRIKGLLREQAEILDTNNSLENSIVKIFGVEGETDKSQSYLSVSNFSIPDYEINKAYLYSKIRDERRISRSEVINYFTSIRTMTSIDEDGIAKDSSLRKFRVLNKGLIFSGEICFDKEQENDINNMILLLRRIGTMRNRGLGHVKCSMQKKDDNGTKSFIPTCVERKLFYEITTLEPLIITQQSDDPNMYESMQYIRGTVIQGMFAQNYLRNNNNIADADFTRLVVKGSTVFSNAYPFHKGRLFTPAPFSIVREKYSQNKIHNLLLQTTEEQTTAISSLLNTDKNIIALTIPQEIRLHNKINNQTRVSSEGDLFNYQSLPVGMVFRGHISIENETDRKKLKSLIESGAELRIGRSAMTEYGKIRFEWIPEDNQPNEKEIISEKVIMRLLSDTIILNNYGFSSLDYKDIKQYLKGDVTILNVVARKSRIEGFLNVWKLRKPSEIVFAAGSCFLLNKLPDNFEDLKDNGLGERTHEGYGEVMFIPVDNNNDQLKYQEPLIFTEEFKTPFKAPETASTIINSIYYNQIKIAVEGKALSDAHNTRNIPSNHLLGKLQGMALDIQDFVFRLDTLRDPAKKQLRDSYLDKGNSLLAHLKEIDKIIADIIINSRIKLEDYDCSVLKLKHVYIDQFLIQLRRNNNS